MKYLSLCVVFASATLVSAQAPPDKPGDKISPKPITLTGCVSAGTESNTYMLSNVQTPDTPVGTSGSAVPQAVYWLSPPSKLKGHVGQQVRISGVLDDEVKNSKVKTEDGKVELKQSGKKVEAPEGTRAAAAMGPDDKTRTSYKVRVSSVKQMASSCPK